MRETVFLAHAFGQRYELPIPLFAFVLGGAAIVLVSFALIGRRSVAVGAESDVADETHIPAPSPVWSAVGLIVLVLLVLVGLVGSQEVSENILPTVFWLLVWIAVPLSCAVLGDWTKAVNPVAAVARWADSPRLRRRLVGASKPLPWPHWLGWWPAVIIYFVVACGELIFNQSATLPRVTATALLLYTLLSAFFGLLFGEAWRRQGEMFTVLFDTWGRLGYFRFGAPWRQGFGGGLAGGFQRSPSRLAFVLLLLVSVNFDGLIATPAWSRAQLGLPRSIGPGTDALRLLTTVAFLILVLATLAIFGGFAAAAARAGGQKGGGMAALSGLLASLVPIAFGYLLAHNLQYLLVNGQLLLPLIGNPVGQPGWPIHLPYPFNDDYEVHRSVLPTAVFWYFSVLVIIAVHVYAVLLAHHHMGKATTDSRRLRNSELPWLVAMVAYTMLSLWLLAQPLVKEPTSNSAAAPPAAAVRGQL
jgi:lipid-A-disaccharide synthase-like uncharacterized protein